MHIWLLSLVILIGLLVASCSNKSVPEKNEILDREIQTEKAQFDYVDPDGERLNTQQADCRDSVWKECPSGAGMSCVVYPKIISLSTDLMEFLSDEGIAGKLQIGELCKYGFGADVMANYHGDGLPIPKYFGLQLQMEDSASAQRVAQIDTSVDVYFDADEYAGSAWVVMFHQSFNNFASDSVISIIQQNNIPVNKIVKIDRNRILFFGRCLTNEEAQMLQQKILLQGVESKVVQLVFIETDL
jgi:hypothetical protein